MKRAIPTQWLQTGAALGVCALVLASCGGGDGFDTPPPPPSAMAPAPTPDPAPAPDPTPDPAPDPAPAPVPAPPPYVQAKCTMDATVAVSFEEQRLPSKLSSDDTLSFSEQLLEASGFNKWGPAFAVTLCNAEGLAGASSYDEAVGLLHTEGKKLWQATLDRVQGRVVEGTLPQSDDRMLYWARLTMTLVLRQWMPDFPLSEEQRAGLQNEFERASRGQLSIDFPEGSKYKRILVSGFDPFTLGPPNTDGNLSVRIGNPSGATILSLDGNTVELPDGTTAVIRTFILPVNYGPFIQGMQEDTLGPWFKPGLKRVDASISMSQGSGAFHLEHFNGRYHFASFPGNDNLVPACAAEGGSASVLDCDIYPPERWLGYAPRPWVRDSPPQFTQASLPFQAMIDARTGEGIINRDTNATGGWTVVRRDTYSATTACFPGAVGPFDANCARTGGGGNYLSNASAYRNTLLRDAFKLTIPAGHIHTPVMTRFGAGSDGKITDSTFEGLRDSIVAQGRNLVFALVKTLSAPAP